MVGTKRHLVVKLPKKNSFRTIAVLVILVVITTQWPHESTAIVQHIAHSLRVLFTAASGGGVS